MTDKTPGFQHAIQGTVRRIELIDLAPYNIDVPKFTLTTRQRDILRDRLNGHSWRTIANAYHITEATARGHHRAALANIERARKAVP